LNKSPADQKISELTNVFKGMIFCKKLTETKNPKSRLFKEIISSKSRNERQKLASLFEILLEYLSSKSLEMPDKLVSSIAYLLALQVNFYFKVVSFEKIKPTILNNFFYRRSTRCP
jgi:hypothetical protein